MGFTVAFAAAGYGHRESRIWEPDSRNCVLKVCETPSATLRSVSGVEARGGFPREALL